MRALGWNREEVERHHRRRPDEGRGERDERMAQETGLKPCSYYVVHYVPDLVRGEPLNIGVFLHSPSEGFLDCLFTNDFAGVRRIHPQADVVFLRELQPHFEQQIKEYEQNLESLLEGMRESYSNLIQLSEPRPCLLANPQVEIRALFERHVGPRAIAAPRRETRMRIRQQLTEVFRCHGLLDSRRFEKKIPAEPWTQKGDPFTFDFGYRPPEVGGKLNGHIKLIHALSLRDDPDVADLLGIKLRCVCEKEPAELTAVVEGLPPAGDETAAYSERVLKEHEIALQPLAGVEAYAESVRRELEM